MKILVPVDDILFAEVIVQFLKEQSWPEHSLIRVVHVLTPLQTTFRWPNESLEKAANHIVDAVVSRCREALPKHKVEGVIRKGNTTDVLKQEAADWPADLVVIGSHSREGIGKKIIGSVSSYMAQHANCPVVVLRPAFANHSAQVEPIWLEDLTAAHREYLEQHAGERPFPLDGTDWSRLVAMRMQHEAETAESDLYHHDLMEQLHSLDSPLAHERAQIHDSHVHWFTIRGGAKRPRTMEQEDAGKHALRVLSQVASNKTLKAFERDWLEKRLKAWGAKPATDALRELATDAVQDSKLIEEKRKLPMVVEEPEAEKDRQSVI